MLICNINEHSCGKGPVIIYQLGWGLGNFKGGGNEKNSTPNGGGVKISFMNPLGVGRGGAGVTNMISISFSGIKMPPLISLIVSSFMPHFSPPPPKNEDMKRYAYAEMPSLSQILLWQCTPSLDHAQVQTNAYRHMGSILTSY